MSLKGKINNMVIRHPKLLTFGIGLAITLAIGTISGSVDNSQAYAFMCPAKWCCC
jgi:hypothetical protein